MKHSWTILSVLVLTAGFVAWQLWYDDGGSITAEPDAQVAADPATPVETLQKSGSSQSKLAKNDFGPTVEAEQAGATVCESGTAFATDPETGSVLLPRRCVPIYPPAPDPYSTWDNDSLAAAAYNDPGAAQELGLRLLRSDTTEQEAMGVALLIRSVAISGDPEAFRKAISARYSETASNGIPQIRNLKQQLVFSIIGRTLGDNRFEPALVESILLRAQINPSEIDRVRTNTHAILENMASLQTEMTGDTSIRRALDNA